MARYSAEEAKQMEYQGADTFRIEQDGGRKQVVFLYTDEKSVDGWAHHRLPGPNFYTFVVDCPRKPKDPVEKCPACQAGVELSTRVFVRMLDCSTGKCIVWDKPASFRKELAGLMHYHNPLYKQKFEITRTGTGLNTRYTMMPIGDSGIDEKKYKELCKEADEACGNYVRPIEKFEEIKARSDAAVAEQVQVEAQGGQQGGQPQQNAWAQTQPPQGNQQWGAPAPQQWGAPQQQAAPQQPAQQGGWAPQGQQPPQQAAPAQQGWNAAPQGQPAQQGSQTPWAQPPQGGWAQPPQN